VRYSLFATLVELVDYCTIVGYTVSLEKFRKPRIATPGTDEEPVSLTALSVRLRYPMANWLAVLPSIIAACSSVPTETAS